MDRRFPDDFPQATFAGSFHVDSQELPTAGDEARTDDIHVGNA
jgi:hypothetical protein